MTRRLHRTARCIIARHGSVIVMQAQQSPRSGLPGGHVDPGEQAIDALIREIREGGVTILMIEHVMQAVIALCDDVYVMAQGRMIAAGRPDIVCRDPLVIEAYLGHGAATRMQEAGNA